MYEETIISVLYIGGMVGFIVLIGIILSRIASHFAIDFYGFFKKLWQKIKHTGQ